MPQPQPQPLPLPQPQLIRFPNPNNEIVDRWIEDPLIDPYSPYDKPKKIELSVHSKSKYVGVYKKVINELLTAIRWDKHKRNENERFLSIQDCKSIKNNLPIIHTFIGNTTIYGGYTRYDHLFIKYFIKRRGLNYDTKYLEDDEIKLYLQTYNAIKRKNGVVVETKKSPKLSSKLFSKSSSFIIDNYTIISDLLYKNVELGKTDLSIEKLIINLCIDILPILYMHRSKITEVNYKIALRNKKILQYVLYFNIHNFVEGSVCDDINAFFKKLSNEDAVTKILLYLTLVKGVNEKDLDTVFTSIRQIVSFLKKKDFNASDVFSYYVFCKMVTIYDTILYLYGDHLTKDIVYKELEDKDNDEIEDKDKDEIANHTSYPYPYCKKDEVDILSLHKITEFNHQSRKYITTIYYYSEGKKDKKDKSEDKVHYYCYDTVELYNYILYRISIGTEPVNLYLGRDAKVLSDDNLDDICDNIKKLTKQPTFNSHIDIRNAIKRNREPLPSISFKLSLVKDVKYTKGTEGYETNSIIGDYNIELTCDICGILFPINNGIPTDSERSERSELSSRVMTLPIFKEKEKDAIVKYIIEQIQGEQYEKLNTAKFGKVFPYREDNKFVDLHPFDLDTKFYYYAILKEEMIYLKKLSFVEKRATIKKVSVPFNNYVCIVEYTPPPYPSLFYSIKKDGDSVYNNQRLFENRCRFIDETNEVLTNCLAKHKFVNLDFTLAYKEYLDCILHTLQYLNSI
jgi:hypothetical protein